jgi:pyruvate dehydrogenase E1 component
MLPFFFFYSMFGFQRIGDLIWATADSRARGFLIGATAGRTSLAGEGLQHQDGHSQVAALAVPNLRAYDPCFAHELATIVEDGLERMVRRSEDLLYYLTVYNETYAQPERPPDDDAGPAGVREGVLRGAWRVRRSRSRKRKQRAHLLASGPIVREALAAAELLEERFDVAADVWSVTSWQRLRQEALECERWNRLHPADAPRVPHVQACFEGEGGVFVAASDYLKVLPESLARWLPGPLVPLGTDGFGRSDGREQLRAFFEVDARHIAQGALWALAREGALPAARARDALAELELDPEATDPMTA